jgi:hypothetical protein
MAQGMLERIAQGETDLVFDFVEAGTRQHLVTAAVCR